MLMTIWLYKNRETVDQLYQGRPAPCIKMRCHISSVKHLVKFQNMNGITVLCLCTEITVTNMNHFTVLCKGTEIVTTTYGHYFNCTVLDKNCNVRLKSVLLKLQRNRITE